MIFLFVKQKKQILKKHLARVHLKPLHRACDHSPNGSHYLHRQDTLKRENHEEAGVPYGQCM